MENTNVKVREIINGIPNLSEDDLIHLRFKLAQIDAIIVKVLSNNIVSSR